MKSEMPMPFNMLESPELGLLHALQSALELAERILGVVHPELEQMDLFPDCPPFSREAYLADAVLTHIAGLEVAIARYRHLVEYRSARLGAGSGDDF